MKKKSKKKTGGYFVIALLAVGLYSAYAADPLPLPSPPAKINLAPAKAEDGPLFQVQPFAALQTYDLDRGKGAVGLSAVVNVTEYIGAEVEAYSFSTKGVFVDRGAASLRYNVVIPNSKTRPYGFGGAWYNFEARDAYGFHAGIGVAHQFAKFFTPFADARFHKPLNGRDTATSCIVRGGLSIGF